jgi:hypothetical protein
VLSGLWLSEEYKLNYHENLNQLSPTI